MFSFCFFQFIILIFFPRCCYFSLSFLFHFLISAYPFEPVILYKWNPTVVHNVFPIRHFHVCACEKQKPFTYCSMLLHLLWICKLWNDVLITWSNLSCQIPLECHFFSVQSVARKKIFQPVPFSIAQNEIENEAIAN